MNDIHSEKEQQIVFSKEDLELLSNFPKFDFYFYYFTKVILKLTDTISGIWFAYDLYSYPCSIDAVTVMNRDFSYVATYGPGIAAFVGIVYEIYYFSLFLKEYRIAVQKKKNSISNDYSIWQYIAIKMRKRHIHLKFTKFQFYLICNVLFNDLLQYLFAVIVPHYTSGATKVMTWKAIASGFNIALFFAQYGLKAMILYFPICSCCFAGCRRDKELVTRKWFKFFAIYIGIMITSSLSYFPLSSRRTAIENGENNLSGQVVDYRVYIDTSAANFCYPCCITSPSSCTYSNNTWIVPPGCAVPMVFRGDPNAANMPKPKSVTTEGQVALDALPSNNTLGTYSIFQASKIFGIQLKSNTIGTECDFTVSIQDIVTANYLKRSSPAMYALSLPSSLGVLIRQSVSYGNFSRGYPIFRMNVIEEFNLRCIFVP